MHPSRIKRLTAIVLLLFGKSLFAQTTSTIQWNTTYQTIDGFGAACDDINACETMTSAQAASIFDPTTGIGLSIFRDAVPFDGTCSTTCEFRSPNTEKYAVSYGLKIMATIWSPPASMKSNGSVICNLGPGNIGVLNPSSYAAFATYLQNYANQFKSTYGQSIYSISPANEPDYCSSDQTYGYGTAWTTATYSDFVTGSLIPTFSGSGIKIMIPEASVWTHLRAWADPIMTGSSASAIGIVAGHAYGGGFSAHANQGSAHLWETEVSIPQFGAYNGSISNAITIATNIHNFMVKAGANAYLYWRIANSTHTNDNEALIQSNGSMVTRYSARFYVLGNWSKFVRPGWIRIGASNPSSRVYVSAFRDPSSGNFAIVVVNSKSTPARNVTFTLNGATPAAVTPYVTDAHHNLTAQPVINLKAGSFTTTLNPLSVTTFVGTSLP